MLVVQNKVNLPAESITQAILGEMLRECSVKASDKGSVRCCQRNRRSDIAENQLVRPTAVMPSEEPVNTYHLASPRISA
jgi:hypothetical protein